MSRRIIRDTDFMEYIMTPPRHEEYEKNKVNFSIVKIRDNNSGGGLGELPVVSSGESRQDWVMPVVIIVVSAMALMTLYAVLSKR